MPAATWLAPRAGAGSATVTVSPRCAARQATLRPMTPPPTTTAFAIVCAPYRRHDPDQVPAVGSSPASLSVRSAPGSRASPSSLCPYESRTAGRRSPTAQRPRATAVPVNPGRVVVAGGGLAALRTAEELRARGYQGQVTILAAEPRPPYDRPPLSKQVLMAPPDAEPDTTLKADVDALGIDLHLGEAVTGAEIAVQPGGGAAGEAAGSSPAEPRGTVRTARGTYPFGCLVAATGAAPVALPGTGRQRVLRTHDDAMALRGLLRPGL